MNDQGPPQEPPMPPPSDSPGGAARCPNCGAPVAPRDAHCPNCGARLSALPNSALSTTGTVGLGCVALVLGGFGTCSLVVSVPSLFSRSTSDELGPLMWIFLALGAGASYLAILCVRRIIESIRARRDKP